eukprot:XP_015576883.1 LOB domain-containing protein 2 [Ricinus communis]
MSRENNGESSRRRGCAACKHQRRKCGDVCLLQPYFGVDRTEDLQAAQKVFGISNMNKMMRELEVKDRAKAIESLVWEAWLWNQDKVNGPLGHYRQLQQENALLKNQINHLNQKLQILSRSMSLGNLQGMVPNDSESGRTYGWNSENLASDLAMYNNNNSNINADVVRLPLNSYPTAPSWPIQQRQENLVLNNYGTNIGQPGCIVPSLVQSQQRGNLGNTRVANSFNAQGSHTGSAGFCENAQASVPNTNFMHGHRQGQQQMLTQKLRGEYHGSDNAILVF